MSAERLWWWNFCLFFVLILNINETCAKKELHFIYVKWSDVIDITWRYSVSCSLLIDVVKNLWRCDLFYVFWLRAIAFLREMGKMRLFVAVLFLVAQGVLGFCPSLCSCKGNRSGDGFVEAPKEAPKELLKLSCGGTPVQITELKEIDLSKLWMDIVSL